MARISTGTVRIDPQHTRNNISNFIELVGGVHRITYALEFDGMLFF